METTIKSRQSEEFSLSDSLGLKTELLLVQNWISQREEIRQAFVLANISNSNIDLPIAFIELATDLSKSQKSKYASALKNELFEIFENHVLPCTFVFMSNLDKQYGNGEFEELVLRHKFKTWETFETQLDYWSDALIEMPHLHNLPTDKFRPVNHNSSRSHLTRTIELNEYNELRIVCKNCNVDFFTLFQTVFSILICRYSNDSDIVIGTKFSQIQEKNNNIASNALFDNLILRNYISGNPKFCELLEQNKSLVQIAYLNQTATSKIQKRIAVQENITRQMFQLKLDYQVIQPDDIEVLNQFLTSMFDENTIFKHDLELSITNTGQCLFLNWFYDANIFCGETIDRFADSLESLIHGIVLDTSTPVYSLSILKSCESSKLLLDWNNTQASVTETLIDLAFEKQVNLAPDSIALKYDNQSLSYQSLNSIANHIAKQLFTSGVKTDAIVATYLPESFSFVIAILGILKTHSSYLPLDTNFPISNLVDIIQDAGISTIITTRKCSVELPSSINNIIYLDESDISNISVNKNSDISKKAAIETQSSKNAYLLYTSGSTNKPKGVLGTHKSVINRINWMKDKYRVGADDIFCLKTSISSVDHVAEIFQPLLCGASLVLFKQEATTKPDQLSTLVYLNKISRITLLPSTLKGLIGKANPCNLKSLKTIISSGEPLYMHLVDTFYNTFGNSKTLLNLYGSTETGADVSYFEVNFKEPFNVLKYFKQNPKIDFAEKNIVQINEDTDETIKIVTRNQSEEITASNVSIDKIKDRFINSKIPDEPTSIENYNAILEKDIVPFLINVAAEKYIGHMTSPLPNFIPELARFIAEANQNVVKIETAKSMTFVERQVLTMLHRLFFDFEASHYDKNIQKSDSMFGIVTSGGSLSNITALYCARNSSLLAKGIEHQKLIDHGAIQAMASLNYRDSVILVSRLAHYSIRKSASLLGIGQDNLIIIEQDQKQKINLDSLEKTILNCHQEKKHIIAIIGIAGATETGTIDPLDEIANIAQKHNIYFHVDAAWGGAFMFSDKYKHKLKGIERADSITICAHKQLYISQGMSVCLFRDPKKLFSITTHADYQSQKGSFDLGQFTLEGSRPAVSMLLHASLHLFSKKGYAQLIDQSMEKAAFLSKVIENSDCFQLIGENDLNIINYRYIPRNLRNKTTPFDEKDNAVLDQTTEQIQKIQFANGKTFVSKTRIFYKPYSSRKITVFRVVLANPNTSYQDILDVLEEQLDIANRTIENDFIDTSLAKILPTNLSLSVNQNELVTVPIGKPINNVKMYVLDKYLNPVPIGVTGELYIVGDCLANGYLNNADLNKQSFVTNPFSHSRSLMFRSGDLARRLADGNIEYLGRKDLQVKLNGHRVKLHEIKAQLDKLEEVKNSIVLVENGLFSESLLTAYIELKKIRPSCSNEENIEKIKNKLNEHLPDFMVPSYFKVFDNIPLTLNGKVDFKRL